MELHHPPVDAFTDAVPWWPCMICGEWRPDPAIAVAHRPTRLTDTPMNVRHCTDRPLCVAYATAPGPWHGYPTPAGWIRFAVAATLRKAADFAELVHTPQLWRDIADAVDQSERFAICPVCEDAACDPDCPLAAVRASAITEA